MRVRRLISVRKVLLGRTVEQRRDLAFIMRDDISLLNKEFNQKTLVEKTKNIID